MDALPAEAEAEGTRSCCGENADPIKQAEAGFERRADDDGLICGRANGRIKREPLGRAINASLKSQVKVVGKGGTNQIKLKNIAADGGTPPSVT